jgi:hypothetical protein
MRKLSVLLIALLYSQLGLAQALDSRFVRILAAGDTQLGNEYVGDLPRENPIQPMFAVIQAADISMVNYEGTLCDQNIQSLKCAPSRSCWAFRAPTRSAAYLAEAGFSIVNLANNHIFDFGSTCADETKSAILQYGMSPIGLKSTANSPMADIGRIVQFKGRRIAFLGFHFNNTMSRLVSLQDDASVARVVQEYAAQADIVVVNVHAGAEGPDFVRTPNEEEVFLGANRGNVQRFAKIAVDNGADLIVAHGPHVMRGMELYRDRLILYSIGNFATYSQFSYEGLMGLSSLVSVDLDETGAFRQGQITALRQYYRDGVPQLGLDPKQRAISEMARLTLLDFYATPLVISTSGQILKK